MKRARIKRGSPMARGKKRMAPRSKKRIREDRAYAESTKAMVEARGTRCEFVDKGARCESNYDDRHHILTQGRSGGRHSDRVDHGNSLLLCRVHHDWVGEHPREALKLGLVRHGRQDNERWTE